MPVDLPSTPQERLLTAADDLFYREGVHTVGIDRVIAAAGVAKATLYSSFGSKDGLIAAYLEARHREIGEGIERAINRHQSPRDRLLGVFDFLIELSSDPAYQGCAFANATAEAHAAGTGMASDAYRKWIRGVFTDLATQAGVMNARVLGRQLHLLWDGAAQSARMDDDQQGAWAARAAAAVLLDATLPAT
ncbi:TetR/AcrR family transcriptional regulator [Kineosporia sp. J2-2]|uniref:TetR/AcrR family transcriptional regulator n=1 Tax=Kineosporia corallincola TaxID=2835133 RepID=A0ABS5TC96_9ACTN|nr:TetR/AcrR family transcriptional regulator [Kineosporia corallincola]MBT0768666.1 TetR/AcrR family transcriptional regulator [Kineosporia corallincola]